VIGGAIGPACFSMAVLADGNIVVATPPRVITEFSPAGAVVRVAMPDVFRPTSVLVAPT
jgi:hypothetical protein